MMIKKYDVGAYIWPAYCNNERTGIFWPDGIGEWQSVISSKAKFPGHGQPKKPLWGYVNEADPFVMEMQIEAAVSHGVNVFIYDWYWYDKRPFLENCLNDGFMKARNCSKMKFYLMWANHDASSLWDKRNSDKPASIVWLGSQDRAEFEKLCERNIEKYFSHPSYYRIEDKPVFMIYDIDNLIRGLGGVEATKDALDWFRNRTAQAGFGGIYLQGVLRKHRAYNITGVSGDNIGTQHEVVEQLGFDSVTHYQYCHFTNIDRDYMTIMKDVVREWEDISETYTIPYNPHVSIGWDNNPRFHNFRPGIITDNGPENFKKALVMAKEYIDQRPGQAPLVTLNSWNEWTEDSYLEPDTNYGYGYLEAVRDTFLKKED
jgi:hypothetical protein